MTPEQKITGQAYSARAMAAINDPEKFDAIMAEFEQWKEREGIQ
jgi:hypothetical protein